MKKSVQLLFIHILLVFFLIQFVIATDTQIKIKTLPNYEIQLTTSKANTANFEVIDKFIENSDEKGDISFTTSTDDSEFNVIVYLKDSQGKTVSSKNFTNPIKIMNHASGELLLIKFAPPWYVFTDASYEETKNETNATVEAIDNSTQIKPLIETNESIEQNKTTKTSSTKSSRYKEKFLSKKTYYLGGIIGFLLLVLIVLVIIKKIKLKIKKQGLKKIDKILDKLGKKTKKPKTKKDLIKDIKKKMKEVEEEMEELKD